MSMNTKEQFVLNLIEATKNNELIWISKNISGYIQYFNNNIVPIKILGAEYKFNTVLLCEEVNNKNNKSLKNNMFDYINENTIYNIYLIKESAIQTTISCYEISRNIYLNMLKEIVDNYSDRYLSNLLQ